MHPIDTQFVTFTRLLWRLDSTSVTLRRSSLWGIPLPQSLIEGTQKARPWIFINWKISLFSLLPSSISLLPSNLLLIFFPTLRCFLLCLLNPPLSKRWHIPTWFHFKDRHSFPSHTVSCLSSDYPCMSTREFIPHLAGNSPHNPALFQVTQSLSVQRHI